MFFLLGNFIQVLELYLGAEDSGGGVDLEQPLDDGAVVRQAVHKFTIGGVWIIRIVGFDLEDLGAWI